MSRPVTKITLTDDERQTLQQWMRSSKTEQRLVLRARIIWAAAEGRATQIIAQQLGQRSATVSKWRLRFARLGVDGLRDGARSGTPRRYDAEVEQRILQQLDQPPPRAIPFGTVRCWLRPWATFRRPTFGGSCGDGAFSCSDAAAGV